MTLPAAVELPSRAQARARVHAATTWEALFDAVNASLGSVRQSWGDGVQGAYHMAMLWRSLPCLVADAKHPERVAEAFRRAKGVAQVILSPVKDGDCEAGAILWNRLKPRIRSTHRAPRPGRLRRAGKTWEQFEESFADRGALLLSTPSVLARIYPNQQASWAMLDEMVQGQFDPGGRVPAQREYDAALRQLHSMETPSSPQETLVLEAQRLLAQGFATVYLGGQGGSAYAWGMLHGTRCALAHLAKKVNAAEEAMGLGMHLSLNHMGVGWDAKGWYRPDEHAMTLVARPCAIAHEWTHALDYHTMGSPASRALTHALMQLKQDPQVSAALVNDLTQTLHQDIRQVLEWFWEDKGRYRHRHPELPEDVFQDVWAIVSRKKTQGSEDLEFLQTLYRWKDAAPLREKASLEYFRGWRRHWTSIQAVEHAQQQGAGAYLVGAALWEGSNHGYQTGHYGQAQRMRGKPVVAVNRHKQPRYYTYRDELIARAAEQWLHDPAVPAMGGDITPYMGFGLRLSSQYLFPQGQELAQLGQALEAWWGAWAKDHPRVTALMEPVPSPDHAPPLGGSPALGRPKMG